MSLAGFGVPTGGPEDDGFCGTDVDFTGAVEVSGRFLVRTVESSLGLPPSTMGRVNLDFVDGFASKEGGCVDLAAAEGGGVCGSDDLFSEATSSVWRVADADGAGVFEEGAAERTVGVLGSFSDEITAGGAPVGDAGGSVVFWDSR